MTSANVQLVQSLYAAFSAGDPVAVMSILSPGIVWNEAENFPYADGNPYVGPQAVAAGVFARLGGEWDGFTTVIDEILDAGDRIVALGRYTGTYAATGKAISAQMVHVWTAEGGQLATFQQYVDTLQVAQAMT